MEARATASLDIRPAGRSQRSSPSNELEEYSENMFESPIVQEECECGLLFDIFSMQQHTMIDSSPSWVILVSWQSHHTVTRKIQVCKTLEE
jgi:hypothetical protein